MTTIAGGSAALHARTLEGVVHQLGLVMRDLGDEAYSYRAGSASEEQLGQTLREIEADGYFILPDRRWPGSRKAQVDFVVVGPAGVFLVDAKSWRDVSIVEADGRTHVFQGQDDVTDRFDNFARLARETEAELSQIGLAANAVHAIAVFTNRTDLKARLDGIQLLSEIDTVRYILSHHNRLDAAEVSFVLETVAASFPPCPTERQPALEFTAISAAENEDAVGDETAQALFTVDDVNDIVVAGMLAEPIESWMSFLHPEQARLIYRSFNGPSRIRGAAGTGKTVVGLHRAAYLARTRPGKVLVTTYVRTLPDVLNSLMRRLAPEVAQRVEFSSVHAVAARILRDAGLPSKVSSAEADSAWTQAWLHHGRYTSLGEFDKTGAYWRDEVRSVIKARNLASLEAYLACGRAGRNRSLKAEQRAAVWTLFTAYEAELRGRKAWDWEDLINRADAILSITPNSGYSAVIVDEAQDLSASMVRMLHRLVGDQPDGFNLIGDGQQSIYPGGYTLAELGISIQGRGVVMSRNYRNTAEIADFAASFIKGDAFVDIEMGTAGRADVAETTRRGDAPRLLRFRSLVEHNEGFLGHVQYLLSQPGIRLGDIGILAFRTNQVNAAIRSLNSIGVPTVNLVDYDGRPVDAVKVGTIKRAKGLEFKQVLLVQTPLRLITPLPVSAPRAEGTEIESDLERRELFVAMTRARDGLWVGVA